MRERDEAAASSRGLGCPDPAADELVEEQPDEWQMFDGLTAEVPEEEHFEAFWQQARGPLRRLAQRMVQDRRLEQTRWDVDDVVQEALATTRAKWATINPDDRSRYVYARRVLINRVLRLQDKERREREARRKLPRGWTSAGGWSAAASRAPERQVLLDEVVEEALDEVIADPQTTEAEALARALVDDVLEAIAELPDRQAAAAYLVKIGGLSQSEAAEVMGISPNSVGTHLRRGTKALQSALGHWDSVTGWGKYIPAVFGLLEFLRWVVEWVSRQGR